MREQLIDILYANSECSRPTNNRIAQLELENQSLRQQWASGGTTAKNRAEPRPGTESSSQTPIGNSVGPQSEQLHLSNTGGDTPHPEAPEKNDGRNTSPYHGPTSTAYDDPVGLVQQNGEMMDYSISESWSRHLLFAQTAKQSKLVDKMAMP